MTTASMTDGGVIDVPPPPTTTTTPTTATNTNTTIGPRSAITSSSSVTTNRITNRGGTKKNHPLSWNDTTHHQYPTATTTTTATATTSHPSHATTTTTTTTTGGGGPERRSTVGNVTDRRTTGTSIGVFKGKEFDHDTNGTTMEDIHEIDHHVDVLQTYNTALCYLCSINANVNEIANYLYTYPQSLLMEDVNTIPEDSATYILQQQSQSCQCQLLNCHLNRIQIMDLIMERGYIYFRTRSTQQQQNHNNNRHKTNNNHNRNPHSLSLLDTTGTTTATTTRNRDGTYNNDECNDDDIHLDHNNHHFITLVQIEHEIRQWRIQELTLRNTIIELSISIRTCTIQFQRSYRRLYHRSVQPPLPPLHQPQLSRRRYHHRRQSQSSNTLSLLACTIGRHANNNQNKNNNYHHHQHDYKTIVHTQNRSCPHSNETTATGDPLPPQQLQQQQTTGENINTINPMEPTAALQQQQQQHHIDQIHQQLLLVQEQHLQLIQNIRHGRQQQFNVFKNHVFINIVRHPVCSTKPMSVMITPVPTTTTTTTADTVPTNTMSRTATMGKKQERSDSEKPRRLQQLHCAPSQQQQPEKQFTTRTTAKNKDKDQDLSSVRPPAQRATGIVDADQSSEDNTSMGYSV